MPPIIKVYKVPVDASGIVGNGGSQDLLDDINHPDLVFDTQYMNVVTQAKDYTNVPSSQHVNESPHYLKVKLDGITQGVDENRFYCAKIGISGKQWITDTHPNFMPRVYLRAEKTYFSEEHQAIFSYTHVPIRDKNGNPYYTITPSGLVTFTNSFVTQCSNGEFVTNSQGGVRGTPNQFGVFAEFWYVEPSGKMSDEFIFLAPSGDFCQMTPPLIECKHGNNAWQAINGPGVVVPSGQINLDSGAFTWQLAPSGTIMRITGWRHTWQRLYNDDMYDLGFLPGEKSPSGIADNTTLVRDFTQTHPWYLYADLKIVNESKTDALEKFCIYPQVRGVLEDGLIKTGFAGLSNPDRPWDQQLGGAMETVGYEGAITTGAGKTICTIMAWEVGNGTSEFPNFCQASGIIDDPLPGRRFSYRDKFPYPANILAPDTPSAANPDKGVANIVKFYQGTVPDPAGDIAFIRSKHVTQTTPRYIWTQPSNVERMVLPSGSFTMDGTPRPGAIMARILWTYRNMNLSTGLFENTFANGINETYGEKVFSFKITGKYYEEV